MMPSQSYHYQRLPVTDLDSLYTFLYQPRLLSFEVLWIFFYRQHADGRKQESMQLISAIIINMKIKDEKNKRNEILNFKMSKKKLIIESNLN